MKSLPVIDLDQIGNENELLPLVKSILIRYDTFLLKNYANYFTLLSLIDELDSKFSPNVSQGFDRNFTGSIELDGCVLEQYIFDNSLELKFPRKCDNKMLNKIYDLLFKVGLFFSQLCIDSIDTSESKVDLKNCSSILTRHFEVEGGKILSTDVDLSFEYSRDYLTFQPIGILSIFPVSNDIQYYFNEKWITIKDEDNCMLVHTGDLLTKLSNGLHSSFSIRIPKNIVYVSIQPNLSSFNLSQSLIDQQIKQFPKIGQKFYPNDLNRIMLLNDMNDLKKFFSVVDSLVSLYKMNHPGTNYAELDMILPQISTMMKKKISIHNFLKVCYIWNDAYIIESDSSGSLNIKLPTSNNLSLSSKSRRLEFMERLETWMNDILNSKSTCIPDTIPILKLNKRKVCTEAVSDVQGFSVKSQKTSKNNSSNFKGTITRGAYPKQPSGLLDRIREKERKAAALLSQKQIKYDQFLKVKTTKVFEIIFTLVPEKPYTLQYLTSLIVDSLRDTNSPIGDGEVELVLSKLHGYLPNKIQVSIIENNLKVFKWSTLSKLEFYQIIGKTTTDNIK